ncbi:7501_t:CDS:2 [Funneliformis geosporum]|uniref:9434_t:CDS:1 n=1 Tax=Funneliformis geosporum TaxID=1117311 RepID=A0A9W4T4Y2_9GLOM|nr:9434_t:CDS:2 [Funneliformis geosporum]CAI2192835.1 7501_t:CDS:2 [Funneliformis geosporum]
MMQIAEAYFDTKVNTSAYNNDYQCQTIKDAVIFADVDTFDVSLLTIEESIYEVNAVSSNIQFGEI